MHPGLLCKINLPPAFGETQFAYPFAKKDADIRCHPIMFGLAFTLYLVHPLFGGNMKFLWLALVVLSPSVWAQTSTTNTNCNASGSSINCTSQTTDNNSQKQAYEAGQQVGAALGTGIAAAMNNHAQSHWVKKFCEGHPGEGWKWRRNSDGALLASGRCPTFGDRAMMASNQFMGRHRDIISGQANETAISEYIAEHRLNPSEEKSYERA